MFVLFYLLFIAGTIAHIIKHRQSEKKNIKATATKRKKRKEKNNQRNAKNQNKTSKAFHKPITSKKQSKEN